MHFDWEEIADVTRIDDPEHWRVPEDGNRTLLVIVSLGGVDNGLQVGVFLKGTTKLSAATHIYMKIGHTDDFPHCPKGGTIVIDITILDEPRRQAHIFELPPGATIPKHSFQT